MCVCVCACVCVCVCLCVSLCVCVWIDRKICVNLCMCIVFQILFKLLVQNYFTLNLTSSKQIYNSPNVFFYFKIKNVFFVSEYNLSMKQTAHLVISICHMGDK